MGSFGGGCEGLINASTLSEVARQLKLDQSNGFSPNAKIGEVNSSQNHMYDYAIECGLNQTSSWPFGSIPSDGAIAVRHNDRRRSGDDLLRPSPISGRRYRAIGQQFIQNRDIHALRFHEVHALHCQCEI